MQCEFIVVQFWLELVEYCSVATNNAKFRSLTICQKKHFETICYRFQFFRPIQFIPAFPWIPNVQLFIKQQCNQILEIPRTSFCMCSPLSSVLMSSFRIIDFKLWVPRFWLRLQLQKSNHTMLEESDCLTRAVIRDVCNATRWIPYTIMMVQKNSRAICFLHIYQRAW